MTLRDLLSHPSVHDVITTDKTVYVILTGDGDAPPIFADKPIITIQKDSILTSEHLPELLQGESLRKGRLADTHGYIGFRMYELDMAELGTTEKQSIAHQLYGTGGRKSLIEQLSGRRVGRSAFLIPNRHAQKIEDWLSERHVAFTSHNLLLEVDQ